MSYSDEHIGLAAEYVLGTLDTLERVQVETMMTVDSGFRDLVLGWEGKLGELHGMVGPIEPPAHVWNHIHAVINGREPPHRPDVAATAATETVAAETAGIAESVEAEDAALAPTDAPSTPDVADEPAPAPSVANAILEAAAGPKPSAALAPPPPVNDRMPVRTSREAVSLVRSARRWRSVAGLTTAIAACAGAFLAVERYRPELVPPQLRVPPKVEVVKVEAPAPAATPAQAGQLVALLQKDTAYPGFILTFDAAARTLTVRRLMAQVEQGKSHELWLISNKTAAPKSLGLVGMTDFTAQPSIAEFDSETVQSAVYAVTVEPAGGSPTGAPTSAPVFAGRLIEVVPPSAR